MFQGSCYQIIYRIFNEKMRPLVKRNYIGFEERWNLISRT